MEDREPSFLTFEDRRERDPRAARKRWVLTGFAAGVAIGGLATALFLGNLGYDIRRTNMHEARLRGILVQTPTVYQVTEGLKEKAPLAEVVASEEQLHAAVERWGGKEREEILEKARVWPQLRIYSAGDMMYFIFFDAEQKMRHYVYVSVR